MLLGDVTSIASSWRTNIYRNNRSLALTHVHLKSGSIIQNYVTLIIHEWAVPMNLFPWLS